MFLNEVMEERRKICNSENGPIWATPENLPFLKYEIYLLFSYSYGSKVPKWKCAHILLCKKYKNSIKLLKIADLQPPDWIQRKKNTLYNVVTSVTFCGTCVGDRHAARGTWHVTRPAAVSSLITARLLLNTFRDTQEQGRGAGELATANFTCPLLMKPPVSYDLCRKAS